MKKYILGFIAVAFAMFVSTANAQSTRKFTIDASKLQDFPCSYTPSTPYCYGLPITDEATNQTGKMWLLNGNGLFMSGYEGLGSIVYTSNDGMGHINFESDPGTTSLTYTGSIDFTYETYLCGRWHNQHCWAITGGTVVVNITAQ